MMRYSKAKDLLSTVHYWHRLQPKITRSPIFSASFALFSSSSSSTSISASSSSTAIDREYKVINIPLNEIFNGERKYLFTTQINPRNYGWGQKYLEDFFEGIDDLDANNENDTLELSDIIVMEKELSIESQKSIGKGSILYDVFDGQQRLVTSCLLLAAIRDCLLEKYPMHGGDAEEVAKMIYPEKPRLENIARITVRKNDGNKWLQCILSRTSAEGNKLDNNTTMTSVLPDKKDRFKQDYKTILNNYDYLRERVEHFGNVDEIFTLLDNFKDKAFLLVQIPADVSVARTMCMNKNKGMPFKVVEEFKQIICFRYNNDEKYQDLTLELWEELCDKEKENSKMLEDVCLFLAQRDQKIRLKKNCELTLMEKFLKNKIDSNCRSNAGLNLFKDEILPTFEAIQNFRDGNFTPETKKGSYPPSIKFLLRATKISTCKELELVLIDLILEYKSADDVQKQTILETLKNVEGIALWMMISKPKPKERFQRCLDVIQNYENAHLSKDEKQTILRRLETEDFGSSHPKRKKAEAILDRLNEHELLKTHQADVRPSGVGELHIEHVLPQKHNVESWTKLWETGTEDWLHRLGNLALLNQKVNSKIGNQSFENKKDHLVKSPYPLTRDIGTARSWDSDAVEENHNKYLLHAKEVWDL